MQTFTAMFNSLFGPNEVPPHARKADRIGIYADPTAVLVLEYVRKPWMWLVWRYWHVYKEYTNYQVDKCNTVRLHTHWALRGRHFACVGQALSTATPGTKR